MVYTTPIFLESNMSEAQMITALNTLETQSHEGIDYIDAYYHDSLYYLSTYMDANFYKTGSHPDGRSDTGHGCGIDATTVDGFTEAQILLMALPPGCITFWTGSAASIPTSHGWEILHEAEGRFIIGAGSTYAAGESGGDVYVYPGRVSDFTTSGHALSGSEIPKHRHTYDDLCGSHMTPGSADNGKWASGPTSHNIETESVNTLANAASDAHTHEGRFTWTGYYNDDNDFVSGHLDLYPPYKAYYWVVKT